MSRQTGEEMSGEITKQSELAKAFIAHHFIKQDTESGIYIPGESEIEELLIAFMEFVVLVEGN